MAISRRFFTGAWGVGSFLLSIVSLIVVVTYSPSEMTSPQWATVIGFCSSFISMLIALDNQQFKAKTLYVIDTFVFACQTTPLLVLVAQGNFLLTGIAIGLNLIGFLVHTAIFMVNSKKEKPVYRSMIEEIMAAEDSRFVASFWK